MWYHKLTNEKDGLKSLLSLFKSEEEFIFHYFTNILFFSKEKIEKQFENLLHKIENNSKIPVRFSKNRDIFYILKTENKSGKGKPPQFKDKKDGLKFTRNNDLFHKKTNIRVVFDSDGNHQVKENIKKYSNITVSIGEKSDYKNYTIAHIWANPTNPYFFTSLWNLEIIPQTFSFITDKIKSNKKNFFFL